jgi:CRISPR/Cas system-associated exonuclease Cas4 (RecB family)
MLLLLCFIKSSPVNIIWFALVNGVAHGFIDYFTSRWSSALFEKNAKTIPIKVEENIKLELIDLVEKIIKMIKIENLPYSSAEDEKCTQCEFLNYCNDRF